MAGVSMTGISMTTTDMMSRIRGLYAITDTGLLQGRLLPAVEAALQGGAQVIQYRDKLATGLTAEAKHREQDRRRDEGAALLALCRQHRIPLLINDDVELAWDIGADGVHLGQGDGSLVAVRARLGSEAIIGVTCHDQLHLARIAARDGASYVAFGAMFASGTKPLAQPCPLAVLNDAKTQLALPLVAIGGITPDNAASVIHAGAHSVAVIASLWQAPDIRARAQQFSQEFVRT